MIFLTLIWQAIKAKKIQWLVYSAIGLGFILLYLSVFPSIQEQAQSYDELYETLPEGLMAAFNITNVNATFMGFLASKHFGLVWVLMIILLAISYARFAIAKEIESKTMGLLLAQPVNRTTLYLARFVAGALGIALFVVLSEGIVWPLAQLAGYETSFNEVFLVGVGGFLFGVSVLAISMCFSALSSRGGRVAAYSGGILLIMYVLFLVSSLADGVSGLKYFSLFHYFAPGDIVKDGIIASQALMIFLAVTVIATIAGVIIFKRRNIQV